MVSVACIILVLNLTSWYFIVQLHGHLVNFIVPFFQLTSRLCLTSKLCPRNISVLFKSITEASSCFLCLFILTSRDATLVISLFFVPSALNTSNEKFIGLVWILLSLTNYSLIPVYVHPESTSAFTLSFLLFFIFMSACTFNFLFPLLFWWFGIIYLFWEFTWEISCTVPTWDCHQNPTSSCHLCCLILPESFISLSSVFSYSPWLCVLPCHIWNISLFLILSFLTGIPLLCVHTCCSWSTLASHSWSYCWTFWCLWAVLALCRLFLCPFCSYFVLLWTRIPV